MASLASRVRREIIRSATDRLLLRKIARGTQNHDDSVILELDCPAQQSISVFRANVQFAQSSPKTRQWQKI